MSLQRRLDGLEAQAQADRDARGRAACERLFALRPDLRRPAFTLAASSAGYIPALSPERETECATAITELLELATDEERALLGVA